MQAVVFLRKVGNFGLTESGDVAQISLGDGTWNVVSMVQPSDRRYNAIKVALDNALAFKRAFTGD